MYFAKLFLFMFFPFYTNQSFHFTQGSGRISTSFINTVTAAKSSLQLSPVSVKIELLKGAKSPCYHHAVPSVGDGSHFACSSRIIYMLGIGLLSTFLSTLRN